MYIKNNILNIFMMKGRKRFLLVHFVLSKCVVLNW